MSQATEELISEEVRVQVHHKPACRIEMNVKTAPHMVREARKTAIKKVGKEITLPGFRKGKAPDETILSKFPIDVENQLHKAVADLAFVAAQKIAKVPLLNNNAPITFDLKSHSDEAGAEVVFSFETEPKVPSVDVEGFTPIPVLKAEVGEKQIEEAIRQMRFFYAQWKPVGGRPVQNGDYIMIDLDTVDGETTQQVFRHVRFEVSKERMASWMRNLVAGAKAGDILEGISEVDESVTEEEKKGFKPKNIRLSILKVEESILPELDDAFAKKVGANDVAHMRESIGQLLNKQADEKVHTELQEQVNSYLVEKYSFELPKSIVDTERNHRFKQLMQDAKIKASWDKMSQEERKRLEEKLEAESAQAVRLFYLSRQIVRNANIPITHQEVQNEAIWLYQAHSGKKAEIEHLPKELYALALSKVILAKAQEFLLSAKNKKA